VEKPDAPPVDKSTEADAKRMRWLLNGNGYFMEEEMLCGHDFCTEADQDDARIRIDEAMALQNQDAQTKNNETPLPEYIKRTTTAEGTVWEDRRVPELQANGTYIIRDPKTKQAYHASTGKKIDVPEQY